MTAKPFDASKLKIKRAKRHIEELETALREYLDRRPVLAIWYAKERARKAKYQMTLFTREAPPEELSAIFGDAIHNLRVALDIMANDVVALCGTVPKGVYFPFANDEP